MKDQKGFIQIPLLIAIIAGVLVLGGAGYFGVKQYQNYQTERTEQKKQEETTRKAEEEQRQKLQELLEEAKQEIEGLKQEQNKQQEGKEMNTETQVYQPLTPLTPAQPPEPISPEVIAAKAQFVAQCETRYQDLQIENLKIFEGVKPENLQTTADAINEYYEGVCREGGRFDALSYRYCDGGHVYLHTLESFVGECVEWKLNQL
ncbi:MAG: hypothetical protein HY001_01040 [Candidatus Portnoybacteria bacterium]|nr:hypothetical protein [Candidatus Portnoybacteria bacterium]